MTHNRGIFRYSIIAMMAVVGAMPASGAVRIGNASRSNAAAYQQISEMRSRGEIDAMPAMPGASVPTVLPNVSDAAQTKSDLDQRIEMCSAIYPNGEFAWTRPTIGLGQESGKMCTAIIELRGYQMGADGADLVIARANLAAGGSVKCNVSEFPESAFLQDGDNVTITVPADREPTKDDVIAVMNQEQKQNAGLKIAAGVLIGGIGGNIAGKNEPGKDGLLGGGKSKVQGTIVGALGGGALTAAGAYSGKVAGDTIMSAGVNAAAGGVVGNIMATGDPVLRVEDCELPGGGTQSCLWGVLVPHVPLVLGNCGTAPVAASTSGGAEAPSASESKTESKSESKLAFFNLVNGTTVTCKCDMTDCIETELVAVKVSSPQGEISTTDIKNETFVHNGQCSECHHREQGNKMVPGMAPNGDQYGNYVPIVSAGTPTDRIPAAIVGVRDKAFGMKRSEWTKIKANTSSASVYARGANGALSPLTGSYDINDFQPMVIKASDGGLIDLGNKARLKSTMVGAGVGGALGAFSGYQGAQDDVENRWVSAVREYKDSLQKFYCATGSRFLGYYNDEIYVPNMSE